MGNAFSKIVAIILSVIIMFIIPVKYYALENRKLVNARILDEITYFTDGVRNTGILGNRDYILLCETLYHLGGGYKIEMIHWNHEDENKDIAFNRPYFDQAYSTEDILRQLKTGDYYLKERDYIKIIIRDKKDEIVAWYGGSVKNESY